MVISKDYKNAGVITADFDEYDIEDLLDVVFEQRDCVDRLQWLQQDDLAELDFC